MKKVNIYIIIIFFIFFTKANAQDEEWYDGEETVISGLGGLGGWHVSKASSGRFSLKSNDNKYRISTGGRFTMDGGYFDQDITPLSKGTIIREARLNASAQINKINIFFEVDFERNEVRLKDITARYNFTDHSFIKAGYFTEPFSLEYLTTTEKIPFIGRPSTARAFAPTRNLGISYRHYNKYFWFEGGIFGDDINQTYQGEDGYSITGRLVGIPIEIPNSHLHVGFSGSYRTGRSRGIDEDGSTYYNRKLNYTAGLQTHIHRQNFITAFIGPTGTDNYDQKDLASLRNGGAKDHYQFAFEIMDIYKNFRWQAEYINTTVNRVINKEKILHLEREANGGGSFPATWSDISYKYGDMRPLNFQGFYVSGHYLIFGGNYKYQRNTATFRRITNRALEFSARYNYTSLNDIEGEYVSGRFFDENGLNNSHAGGTTSSFSAALNFIFTANVRFVAEYTNQKFEYYKGVGNENINMYQVRFQVFF